MKRERSTGEEAKEYLHKGKVEGGTPNSLTKDKTALGAKLRKKSTSNSRRSQFPNWGDAYYSLSLLNTHTRTHTHWSLWWSESGIVLSGLLHFLKSPKSHPNCQSCARLKYHISVHVCFHSCIIAICWKSLNKVLKIISSHHSSYSA